jgi:hypothetical protein
MHEEKRDVSMANCEPICNYVRQAKLVTVKQIALANETEAGLGDRWRWQPFLHHQYFSDASNFQLVRSPFSCARLQTFKSSLSQ